MSSLVDFYSTYEHLIANSLIYSIGALGLFIALRAGVFNLAIAGIMSISAYASALLTMNIGLPWLVSILVGSVIASIAAASMVLPVIRLHGHFLAIATLAFGTIVQVLATNLRGLTKGPSGLVGIPVTVEVLHVAPLLLLLLVGTYGVLRSRVGRSWTAIRLDEEAAAVGGGINLTYYKLLAFNVSTVLVAISGGLWAHNNRVLVPDLFGFELLADMLVFVYVGGLGHVVGPVIGASIITTMPEWLAALARYREFAIGGMLIVVVTYAPGGLVGAFRQVARRLGSARPRAADDGIATASRVESEEESSTHAENLRGGPAPSDSAERVSQPTDEAKNGADNTGGEPVLNVGGVTKYYGGVRALADVDLTVRPSEIVALIGPNGAGKSTLLNVICGVTTPQSGDVRVLGESIMGLAVHDRTSQAGIGRTFQTPRVFDEMSILENVQVGRHPSGKDGLFSAAFRTELHDVDERESRTRAMEALEVVGLDHKARVRAEGLPYGERRRVEIARTLALDPTVLLLDEPAAGLSGKELGLVTDLLRRISVDIPILLIEHNISVVMDMADQISVLDHGQIIATGPPAQVRRDEEVIRAYLGESVSRKSI